MSYFTLCNKTIMSLSSMEECETTSVEDVELKAQAKQSRDGALEKLKRDHETQIQDLVKKLKEERVAFEKQILKQNSQLLDLKSKHNKQINSLEEQNQRLEAEYSSIREKHERSQSGSFGELNKELVSSETKTEEKSPVNEQLRKQVRITLDLKRKLKQRDEEKVQLEEKFNDQQKITNELRNRLATTVKSLDTQRELVRNHNSSKASDSKNYKRKLQNLSAKSDNQAKTIRRLLADLKDSRAKVKTIESAATEEKKASEKLRSSVNELKRNADQLWEENKSLKELTKTQDEKIEEQDKRILELSKDNKSLKDELEDLQQAEMYEEEDEKEMNIDQEEEDMDAEEEGDDGLTELERAQVRILDLEEQVEDLQEKIDLQQEEKVDAGVNNSGETAALIDENKRLQKLREEADSLESELMEEIDNLTKDNEQLTGDLDDAKTKLRPLQRQVAELQGEILAANMKLESFSDAVKGGGSVKMDRYVKQIRQLRTENAEMKSKIRNLENDFEQLENKARREKSVTESLQEKIDDLEEERIMLDERLKSLTTELEDSSTNCARLRKEIADLKS